MPVAIFPSELADPEKGTGILMVCTFGDATDVQWWRDHGLALRQVIGRDGRLVPVSFGAPGWESLDPEADGEAYSSRFRELIALEQERRRLWTHD